MQVGHRHVRNGASRVRFRHPVSISRASATASLVIRCVSISPLEFVKSAACCVEEPCKGFHPKALFLMDHPWRAVVLLVAVWPLLMPPGMCVCRYARGADNSTRFSERSCDSDHRGTCSHTDCNRARTNSSPCRSPGAPTHKQHPPGCSANKKGDNSSRIEQYQPLAPTAVAVSPDASLLNASSGEHLAAARFLTHSSDRTIYLSFCTLLI
jgi:hypothetical protein